MWTKRRRGLSAAGKQYHGGKVVYRAAVLARIEGLRRVVAAGASTDPRVRAVVRHVAESPGLGVSELARAVGLSTWWLAHLFRAGTGCSVFNFILAQRFLRAVTRLQTTNVSVKQLASDLGYARAANFTRSFHNHMGVSPRWFRRPETIVLVARAGGGHSTRAPRTCMTDAGNGRAAPTVLAIAVTLLDEQIVMGVIANPEPDKTVRRFYGQGPMMKPHSDRPEATGLFQSKRFVSRVSLQKLEVLVRQPSDCRREIVVRVPERGTCVMPHSGLHRFSARSTRA
jgi:AraC-like DNA-binding protein